MAKISKIFTFIKVGSVLGTLKHQKVVEMLIKQIYD